jgi:hypothetical protein
MQEIAEVTPQYHFEGNNCISQLNQKEYDKSIVTDKVSTITFITNDSD